MAQLKSQVDQLLSQAISAYVPKNFISDILFPQVKVMQTTGLLPKLGTNHLRIENALKAGRGKYRRVEGVSRSTAGYSIEGHGLEGLVTEDDYSNVLTPYDAEKEEAMALSTMLWLEREKSVADVLSDTATLTQNVTLSGTSQFSDYDNSDPIAKITTAHDAILDGCGGKANTAIMSLKVFRKLRYHPQFLDMLGYKFAKPGGLSGDELAQALDVERVLIGESAYESAKEGQTSSFGQIWGKHLILAVLPTAADLYQVSLGYTVRFANRPARRAYKWAANNPPNANSLLCDDHYDDLISNVGAGYLIKNAIA